MNCFIRARMGLTGGTLAIVLGCYGAFAEAQNKGLDAVFGLPSQSGADFLPPDEAFRLSAASEGPDRIRLEWQVAEGYYLYRSRLGVKAPGTVVQLGSLSLPAGKVKFDDYFGKQEVYYHDLGASVPVARPPGGALDLALKVTYQGCADAGLCYPPETKTLTVRLPPTGAASTDASAAWSQTEASAVGTAGAQVAQGSSRKAARGSDAALPSEKRAAAAADRDGAFVSQQDRLANLIRDGNLFLVLATFFGLGLLLAFTPCVLPMVPILSGLIAGDGRHASAGRGFALSLAYVLGMALTYTLGGIAFAAAGQQAQAVFQQPWIITLFALLFVFLAVSMLGAFTLQMPVAVQTRLAALSNRQTAGSFGGVALMGALSALIVTTCVAPPLVAALAVIGQSGDMLRGGAALFSMSLGMGAPLLIVGASAGRYLPRAGAWMDTVKRFFGVLLLAVAAWMLTRIVPEQFVLMLWAVPALVAAWLLWRSAPNLRAGWVCRVAAAAVCVYAAVLVAGAVRGATDPLMPLATASSAKDALTFRRISSVAELESAVADARRASRPVMLDFYADWCVSCKEMEKYTFTDPAVRTVLEQAVLLQADVTRNNVEDQALLRHFEIFGPPTITFYDPRGVERREFRVVGFMKAPEFARLARRAMAGDRRAESPAHQ